ncbi:hypothetical protein BC830DRAFT_1088942 [Chytriomyces sp. MP71]|nr:hypothetical protein BC830DRAFT_1088942 [Chytriomyces sp. MP71]
MIEHPLVSPVFNNDYAGMPPLLILAGDAEVLRDESIQLARKYAYSCSNAAREGEQDGNPVVELPGRGWDGAGKRKEKESWTRKSVVRHELYKDMVHVWAVMMGRLPMARRALQNVAKFLTRLEGGDELLDYEGGDGVEVNAHLQ